MKIILNQNIDNLGRIGDIVKVRDGYARNYLFPRQLAGRANEGNKAALEHHLRIIEKKKVKILGDAKAIANQIEKVSVTVYKQVGEEEKIFGSVTTAELEELVSQQGVKISRKDIVLEGDIKKVGVYSAKVKVHPDVSAKFKFWVAAES
jgi:large subunit ribosomal protein L9